MLSLLLQRLRIIKNSLSLWPVGAFVAMYLFFTLSAGLAVVARYEFDPSALVHFGHYYVVQNEKWTPSGAIRFVGNEANGGNGYDGQIFYYYARTLFSPGEWPAGFSKAYRAPRIGYPLLAAPFSILGSRATVLGMILLQLGLGVGAIFSLKSILARKRRYLILFYILSPFLLQSTLLLVSDGIVASLIIIGYRNFLRIRNAEGVSTKDSLLAIFWFSLAVLTKESALFLLFPIGLHAVVKRDVRIALYMLAILVPALLWQIYLTGVHGIVPAGKLQVFLTPMSGLYGLSRESIKAFVDAYHQGQYINGVILKLTARWILVLFIPSALFALIWKKPTSLRIWPWGLGLILVSISVLMADHYYFWGVYENISRMFTLMVPALILMSERDEDARIEPFLGVLLVVTLMVYGRILFMTPSFPYDHYQPYHGPSYEGHAPMPR